MDNQNNPNPTSPLGGPLQTPSGSGNLPTSMPTTTQTQPAPTEPGPTASAPFPSSPLPSWPPASEPTIPSTEPYPAPVSPPSWPPQDTTQQTTSVSASPVSGGIGSDPASAWTPPTSVQPEPAQTPTQPEPTVSNPWSNPQPSMDPMSSQQTSAWTPSVPGEPGPVSQPQPQTPTQLTPDLPLAGPVPTQSEPTLSPSGTEPTPTFTPPAASLTGDASEPSSATSPLDNPWGTTPANPTQPSWMNPQTPSMPPSPTEAAPTDLSHLISNNQQEPASMPTAESLIVPTAGVNPEVPNLSTETHKGIPKWLIGLSVGLLIIVLGASAYFILGIGQPSKGTVSLPATTTPQTKQVKPPLPIATASAQPSSTTATGSANFGQISGTSPATSAADLIRLNRQRQQGR